MKAKPRADSSAELSEAQQELATRYFCAGSGYMAYCGAFRVEGDIVIHEIRPSLLPEWNWTELERKYRLDKSTLELIGDAGGLIQYLVRERV